MTASDIFFFCACAAEDKGNKSFAAGEAAYAALGRSAPPCAVCEGLNAVFPRTEKQLGE